MNVLAMSKWGDFNRPNLPQTTSVFFAVFFAPERERKCGAVCERT
jgi:hypothetical protein